MSRRSRTTFALALAGALAAAAPAGAAPPAPRVAILQPGPFAPVFGAVEVELGVTAAEPVVRAELFVDDVRVAVLESPPWRVTVDVGEDNRPHRFRAVVHTASGGVGTMELETPAIRVDDVVDLPLRQLYVTVERSGERVTYLDRDAFTVIDDGDRQTLVTFESGDAPLTAVILVDSSESMAGERLAAALEGAQAFAGGMRSLDEAKVMLFSDRLLRSTPFTGDSDALGTALVGARADGGTALTDHFYAALKLLDGRQGRRVVVVLSDGSDVHSVLGMKDVLWKVRRSQAMVYWIELADQRTDASGLPTSFASSWRGAEENAAELETLRQVVGESGGRISTIGSIHQIDDAFSGILRELREQYVLGYYPTGATGDGEWRDVDVEVSGFGNRVRAREGYVDY